MSDSTRLLAVAVGNTRIRWGVFEGNELVEAHSLLVKEVNTLGSVLSPMALEAELAVMSSVNDAVTNTAERVLDGVLECEIARINRDVGVPLRHTLDEPVTVGADRVLCALAAWERTHQACVVIDAGTAITVDLVDGKGVFQGGAILPGGAMMLAAMKAGTAQLPAVEWPPAQLPKEAIGHNTADAMVLGVLGAARGAIRHLVEQYSELYGGYPQVVATGGDAALFFEDDGLVEHIIPDLQLIGIRISIEKAEQMADEGEG
jgi:type III pantothenate kinase